MRPTRPQSSVPTSVATILRDVGALVAMQAGLMALSAGVAIVFREWYVALAFVLAGGVTALSGMATRRQFTDAPEPQMKHGMVIAAMGWLATATFGMLPFLFAAYLVPPDVMAGFVPAGADYAQSSLRYFRNPLHAFFESMSGWTGSGLTMAVHEPSLPHAIQWWRSLIQWVGGVGVIVLTAAILARPGRGSYALYQAETREEKIHPSIVNTVQTVWKIFVGYTALSVGVLFVALLITEPLSPATAFWQALNHAMTGLSTGGFSVTDNSIATYDAPLVETVLLPIMTLGAIAFPIHYAVLRDRDLGALFDDLQTKWLFILFLVGIGGLTIQHLLTPQFGMAFDGRWDAFRDAAFQFVSALTCTGFQSAPIGLWSAGGKLIVSGAMVLGGAAGSTVGGLKIIRGYTIAKGIRWQFKRVFLPQSAVVNATIGDRTLDRAGMEREFSEAAIVSMLWLLVLFASSLVLVNTIGGSFTYADALFEVASAQGNVGLSTGITGPSMPAVAEAMFLLNMWIGRLEIIPVLVFLRAAVYGLDY